MPLAGAAPEEKFAFQSLTYKGFEIGDILRWDHRMFAAALRKKHPE
jgi:hypothetical protein